MGLAKYKYNTVPQFFPILFAFTCIVVPFFITTNYFISIPISITALFLTYKLVKNYAVLKEDKVVLFVFGKRYDLKYDEIEFVQITRLPKDGYVIYFKFRGRKKLARFPLWIIDKPMLKRLEDNNVQIQYLRDTKPEHFHNPY